MTRINREMVPKFFVNVVQVHQARLQCVLLVEADLAWSYEIGCLRR